MQQTTQAENTNTNVMSLADNAISVAKNTNGNVANNTSRNVMSVADNVIADG